MLLMRACDRFSAFGWDPSERFSEYAEGVEAGRGYGVDLAVYRE